MLKTKLHKIRPGTKPIPIASDPLLQETTASLPSLHTPSAGSQAALPPLIRSRAEAASGLSLDTVRIHYNSEKPAQLGACAYTQGEQIFMGPRTETHLPHEVWHVVQQKQGRVPAQEVSSSMELNDNPILEREADDFELNRLSNANLNLPEVRTSSTAAPVQFLKPLKEHSYLRSPEVRTALERYHTFCAHVAVTDLLELPFLNNLRARLEAVRLVCIDDSLHGNLRNQAQSELTACDHLIHLHGDCAAKVVLAPPNHRPYFAKLYYAEYAWDYLISVGMNTVPIFSKLIDAAAAVLHHTDTDEQHDALIAFHVSRFDAIRNDQNAPLALKNVLVQVMGLTQDIPIGGMGKMTSLKKPGQGPLQPDAPFGPEGTGAVRSDLLVDASRTPETIDEAHGGFLHELTHAAVQRTFHNTPLHLGLRAHPDLATQQQEFQQVFAYRSQTAQNLRTLLQNEKNNLANSSFTIKQLNTLNCKLDYGAFQPLMPRYLSSMMQIGLNATSSNVGISVQEMNDLHRMTNIPAPQGGADTSIYMEYDTTINQMLLWCYDWGIPPANPVYQALANAAQIEVNRRGAELQRQAPPPPPPPPPPPIASDAE